MTARIGAKGQVVIPKGIRERANLHPGDQVEIEFRDGRVILLAHSARQALGGCFGGSGMAARLLDDRAREPR